MTPKEALRQLQSLQDHPGYLYLKKLMTDEMQKKALSVATNPRVDESDRAFNAGLLAAAQAFLDMDQRVILHLQNQLALDDASSATAEQKEPK